MHKDEQDSVALVDPRSGSHNAQVLIHGTEITRGVSETAGAVRLVLKICDCTKASRKI